jgi:hypothetical protein
MRNSGETWRECALRHARPYRLEAEVGEAFDSHVRNGDAEDEAALWACWEWDVCPPEPCAVTALRSLDGTFVGLLSGDELVLFEEAVARREARRSYEGLAGFLGLAKVRVSATL